MIVKSDPELLVKSLTKEVERLISDNEGQFKKHVRRDFREGLAHKEPDEQIQWCNRWRAMYRSVRDA